jgi:citrate synthase
MAMATVHKGLDGIVIDESRVSMVDGEQGDIWYSGYHIDDLARRATFTETLFLLWNDELPTEAELTDLQAALRARRELPAGVDQLLTELSPRAAPMDVLRTAVSMLAGYVPEPNDVDEHLRENLLDIVAKIPTIVARTYREVNGLEPVDPREDLDHAANFLYMIHGTEPAPERARALDVALTLYAEHGMNASTFAAVVAASTLTNPFAAISAAIGTLQGPLHGGATETVVETFEDIGDPDAVAGWVDERLDAGERIPGFGHRVYRVPDPRCSHFRRQIEAMGPDGEVGTWFEIAQALREAIAQRLGEKGVCPNTDLYSGIFYRLLDIPPEFYTTIFAMGRVAGWSAHVIEQLSDNRILRPRIKYVGETGRTYVPLEDR